MHVLDPKASIYKKMYIMTGNACVNVLSLIISSIYPCQQLHSYEDEILLGFYKSQNMISPIIIS